jgi:spore germination protein
MKLDKNPSVLSGSQIAIGISLTVLGVGMITLPREVLTAAGAASGWVSVIISGFVALIVILLLSALNSRYPDLTYYQYNRLIVGKWIGWVITLITTFYYVFFASFEARAMADLIKVFILARTPIEITILIFMGTAVYLILGGVSAIFRLFELYFPFIIIFTLLIILLTANQFEFNHIRPFFEGMTPIAKGTGTTILSFVGIETILFTQAYMKKKQKIKKVLIVGIGIPTLIYTTIVIMVAGIMGVGEAMTLVYPLMELAKSIEIRNFFFERFETFFVPLWILSIFTTFAIAFFLAAKGVKELFHIQDRKAVYGLLPVIFIIAMSPNNINEVFKMGKYVSYSMIAVGVCIPLFLLMISLIRRQKL